MKKMKIRDRIVVYLPIAVAGATIGILGVYSIEMNWLSKILVYIFNGVILFTGFVVSEKIKSCMKVKRCESFGLEVAVMGTSTKWWKKKWWWVLCILSAFVAVPTINLFFFPEVPLSRSLIMAVAMSVGIIVAYFAYTGKTIFKIQPKTLRRIIFIVFGAFTVGFLLWAFFVIPLASYLDIPGSIVLLLLFVLMVVCAFIVDTIMKRRDYRPFMERKGNI